MTGCQTHINRDIEYAVLEGSQDGKVLKINGGGGNGVNNGPRGDLYIKLRMIVPKASNLTKEQIEVLESL